MQRGSYPQPGSCWSGSSPRTGRASPLEPWYRVCAAVGLPPARFWFNWHFEDLELIPAEGPAIMAANHISYLDPFANVFAVHRAGRRARFLAKNDLFKIPVVGRALRGAGQIPVSRGRGDQTPLIEAQEALERGEVVVIYPEGTVTRNPDSMPMEGKVGAIRLSLLSGVPITPLASWGSQAVWQKSGKGSLKFGRPIWVKAAPAVDFSSRSGAIGDRGALHEMAAELMVALTAVVRDLRSRYPQRWTEVG